MEDKTGIVRYDHFGNGNMKQEKEGRYVHYTAHMAEVERLEARIASLEAQVAAMSEAGDAMWDQLLDENEERPLSAIAPYKASLMRAWDTATASLDTPTPPNK